jgi:hypothetical protein
MFSKISYTWTLMGASLDVLKRQKSLLIFPILSCMSCLIVMASFIAPLVLGSSEFTIPNKNSPPADQILFYGYWFLFYFCNYFVIVFFNTAIVACAALSFEGHESTAADGFRAAFSRLPQIIGWALLSATVGIVLRMVEDRSKQFGQIVAGLLGCAWTLVSFLAVPVLVLEKKGPFAALSTSTSLLKKTWGEQLSGNFGFGMIFFLLTIPGIIGIVASVILGQGAQIILVLGLSLSILYLIMLSLVHSVLEMIFRTALYMYARDGRAPAAFSEEMLGSALTRG